MLTPTNIAPYYDDYNPAKNYYRILFKPAVAVQARELTQTQSILQQQITNLGGSIYQQGSMVIPGQVATDPKTNYVCLQPNFGSIGPTPIPINLALFQNQQIQGQTTGLTAQVVYTVAAGSTIANGTPSDPPTIYVKYLNSGVNGATAFQPNEILTLVGSSTGLAYVQSNSPTGLAISVQIDAGIYYIWGFFCEVPQQYLLLNKYSNLISCRVGLEIQEAIVTSAQDPSLLDHAQGSTNYAAPGADRYQINLALISKSLNDTSVDNNFVELLRLVNSMTQSQSSLNSTYSDILNELAIRMYDANGNFAVRNFSIDVRESLDTSFVTAGTVTGAAQGTTSPPVPATISLASSASPTDGSYLNNQLYITGGAGAGQNFVITGYVGATKTATLDTLFGTYQVPDITSTYIISDPTQVNRGVYPSAPTDPSNPPPGYPIAPYGNAEELAIGMESGRAYVDGFRIDTLSTTYVEMEKARTTTQANNVQMATPIGNFIFAKNLWNMPLAPTPAALPDFLTITFQNIKSNGSATTTPTSTTTLGTARVHSMQFYAGANAADPEAVWQMFLFDVNINAGADINAVRSFYLINDLTLNNNDGLFSAGDVCAVFNVTNVNGTGMVPGATVLGPASNTTTSEKLVSYDPINNLIVTECVPSNGPQILNPGTFTIAGGTSGQISNRAQIFNTTIATLIYPLPQNLIKTVSDANDIVQTSYYARQVFLGTRNGSGQFIFNTPSSNIAFSSFNAADYAACVVASSNSADIGNFIDLTQVSGMTFGGSPANTQFSFSILAGLGATAGCTIKLMATVYKTAITEKLKSLTTSTIAYPNPTAVMSLNEADIYTVVGVYDSGDTGVDATTSDPNIMNQYTFDTGQRDYFYDVGSIIQTTGTPGPAGRVLIQFQYFAHSGNGDYFSVDSYATQVPYTNIPVYAASNGTFYALRDCLDFRPRFDNLGQTFAGTGSSYSAALSPQGMVTSDYQYYLGVINKIYLDQYGNFNIISGTPSLTPQPPQDPLDGMMLYTIQLNPYTLSTTDMTITPTKNPVYKMADIGKLEQRIANLEYYTSLNQLETQTANTTVVNSSTGLNAFQNGFVCDNFVDHSVGNVFDVDYNCSVDPSTNTLRPVFIQQQNNLVFQSAVSSGYVYCSGMLMLPYTEIEMIEQTFATDIINVNPFAVFTYYGNISLIPSTDQWYDIVQRPVINISNTTALEGYQYLNQWSGATWGDWQTNWVGTPTSTSSSSVTTNSSATQLTPQQVLSGLEQGSLPAATTTAGLVANQNTGQPFQFYTGTGQTDQVVYINGQRYATGPEYAGQPSVNVTVNGLGSGTEATTTATTVNTTQQITQTRVGIETMVSSQLSSQTVNNSVVSTGVTPYIRSRRIKVLGRHFKPTTQIYPFFNGVNVSSFCRPYCDPSITPSLTGDNTWNSLAMTWGGDFDPQSGLTGDEGYSTIVGDTGTTVTYLTGPLNAPLMTDHIGNVTLFFEIPCNAANEFPTGQRDFRLTDDINNGSNADSYGDAIYTAAGILQQDQETITSIYTPQIVTKQVSQSQTLTQNLGSTTTTTSTTTESGDADPVTLTLWVDPLAQSFLVKSQGGAYVTSIDVYFQTADSSVPITLQVRNMVNGYPGQDLVPFSEVVLYPNNPVLSAVTLDGLVSNTPYPATVVQTSDNATVPTTFTFPVPIYLNDGTEYCFVLIANSVNYFVFTAKIGDPVIGSTNIVSTPPYLGNLFKSQNASTWVADPTQNMKFIINQAQFDPTSDGQVYFTNSSIQPDTLLTLPFETVIGSNLVRVYHKAHMMTQGDYNYSIATLSNIAPGTYNGLTDSQLTGNFSITNVDLNSYTITVPGNPANGTGRVGPDGVIATRNYQYDSICPVVNQFTPSGTTIDWFIEPTTGKSVNTNSLTVQEPYNKSEVWSPIQPNLTTSFSNPQMVASDINETTNIVGASTYDRKSLAFQANLSTSNANLSPMIDQTRMSAILINNQLDDPTFANYTLNPSLFTPPNQMDGGVIITSTSPNPVDFASQVILVVIAVTGGQFVYGDGVLGAVSGATGIVQTWDGLNLTLSGVQGVFQDTEALSDQTSPRNNVIGTVQSFQYVNTITNLSGGLDFGVFTPGYGMTISGASVGPPSNNHTFSDPVIILNVATGVTIGVNPNASVLTVTSSTPFTTQTGASNVSLQQYVRFVDETAPTGCTTSGHYITRQFNLANPANSLNVQFGVNLPPGAFVDCYYRILDLNSTQPFGTINYVLMKPDSTVDTSPATNSTQFKPYSYTVNDVGPFIAFSIKLTLRGGNSSLPPLVQSFRAIASTP